jgi:hypothetical protein
MRIAKHIAPLMILCCSVILAACSADNEVEGDSALQASAAAVTPASSAPTISLGQVAGKWNLRAVPEAGTDTTATLAVLTATADTTGWTLTFPNQPPVPVRVRVSGDTLMTESAEYESARRKGVKVTTRSTMRMQGDSMVGTTIGRYNVAGPDSVIRLRTVGKRAP